MEIYKRNIYKILAFIPGFGGMLSFTILYFSRKDNLKSREGLYISIFGILFLDAIAITIIFNILAIFVNQNPNLEIVFTIIVFLTFYLFNYSFYSFYKNNVINENEETN